MLACSDLQTTNWANLSKPNNVLFAQNWNNMKSTKEYHDSKFPFRLQAPPWLPLPHESYDMIQTPQVCKVIVMFQIVHLSTEIGMWYCTSCNFLTTAQGSDLQKKGLLKMWSWNNSSDYILRYLVHYRPAHKIVKRSCTCERWDIFDNLSCTCTSRNVLKFVTISF